jgi:nickel/cobalt exporter
VNSLPDIVQLVQSGATNPWLFLPLAVLLGAIHALEPGHSKSLMAGYIVAVKGTKPQAALLGLSAAVGHSIVVWALAVAAIYFGDKLIVDKAEPWLELVSGLLIIALAIRLYLMMSRPHVHDHGQGHEQDHVHSHENGHGHGKASSKRTLVSNFDIVWFGFTGGLLPCPSAIAVLLVCIQLRAWGLGLAMVFAFSVGLAVTLVSIGLLAASGAKFASTKFSGFDKWADRLPLISSVIVMVLGATITVRGLYSLGLI